MADNDFLEPIIAHEEVDKVSFYSSEFSKEYKKGDLFTLRRELGDLEKIISDRSSPYPLVSIVIKGREGSILTMNIVGIPYITSTIKVPEQQA